MENAEFFAPRVAVGGIQVPRAQALRALRRRWDGVALLPPSECQDIALEFLADAGRSGVQVVLFDPPFAEAAYTVISPELLTEARTLALAHATAAGFDAVPLVARERPVPDGWTYDLRHLNRKGQTRYTRRAVPALVDALHAARGER